MITAGSKASAKNWLAAIMVEAGYDHPGLSDIDAAAPAIGAWEDVAKVCRIDDSELASAVASHFGLALANIDEVDKKVIRLVPEKVATRYHVVPLRDDDRRVIVATCDPRDLSAEEALRFASGRAPVFEVASPAEIKHAIEESYSRTDALETLLTALDDGTTEAVRLIGEEKPESVDAREVEAAPVVKLANLILRDATRQSASDIHIEPSAEGGVVRFRVDGVLRPYMKLPSAALNRVVSRIKIIGQLDIADRLRPHDGRARVLVDNQAFDLRVSTVPTRDTEKAVIRILNPRATRGLTDLALAPRELTSLRRLFSHRDGIVLVTGPTGSGKTTTIYSGIRELATGEVNVMSVEDPVEYDVPGVTQMQVEPRRDVTFPSALRAILRQDPDIVFVGEIRDAETAEIAVQAAMTGHLVVATLHTSDAVSSITRLVDLGIDRTALAATFRGAISQRLVRRVCAHCAGRVDRTLLPEEERLASLLGVAPVVRAEGCAECGHSGYLGRVAVAEVLMSNAEIEALIARGEPSSKILNVASTYGMRPLLETALERVHDGETTLAEVARVLGGFVDTSPACRAAARALVVDDDPLNRTIVRTLLENNGFHVTEAEDGDSALQTVASLPGLSLVVLDLSMPKLGGEEVLQRLRRAPTTAYVPVIILTASGNEGAEARLIEGGADDYVRKPVDATRFIARVKATLRRAGGTMHIPM